MVDSDKSDNGENQTAKRLREDNSEDEECELPNKKLRSKSPDHIESVDNKKDPIVQVANGDAIASKDKNDSAIVKEQHVIVDKEHENGNATEHDDEEMGELSEKKNAAESKDVKLEIHVKEEEAELNEKEKDKEKGKGKGKIDVKEEGKEDEVDNEESVADKSNDSEVVDGLELSVECASDKEASSSESDKEKETKPRPKTIIVKAKPNDSELEVGSSEAEQSETDDKVEDDNNGKDKKKKIEKRKSTGKVSNSQSGASSGSNSGDEDDKVQGDKDGKDKKKKIEKKRKSTGKVSSLQSRASSESNSEDEGDNDGKDKKKKIKEQLKSTGKESSSQSGASSESNSRDEDYSPRTKKKAKKTASPLKKSVPHKAKAKKKEETTKKPVTDSENGQSGSEDEEMTLADRAKKISVKSPAKKREEDESNSESEDKADGSSDSGAKNKRKGRWIQVKSDAKNDKKIEALKRYLRWAGIWPKYDDLWSGCKSNPQRIKRMKELLVKCGIEGRPTIKKCKKLKIKNETLKEVSELDTSNILSEGRVTRARRIEANKKANITSPSTRREARNLFKRIQPVCDSDTE